MYIGFNRFSSFIPIPVIFINDLRRSKNEIEPDSNRDGLSDKLSQKNTVRVIAAAISSPCRQLSNQSGSLSFKTLPAQLINGAPKTALNTGNVLAAELLTIGQIDTALTGIFPDKLPRVALGTMVSSAFTLPFDIKTMVSENNYKNSLLNSMKSPIPLGAILARNSFQLGANFVFRNEILDKIDATIDPEYKLTTALAKIVVPSQLAAVSALPQRILVESVNNPQFSFLQVLNKAKDPKFLFLAYIGRAAYSTSTQTLLFLVDQFDDCKK